MKRMNWIHVVVAYLTLLSLSIAVPILADPVEFSDKLVIAEGVLCQGTTQAVDMNSDGSLDILTGDAVDGSIIWYEHYGQGSFGPEQVIVTNTWVNTPVFLEDVNGDNLEDLLYIEDNRNEIRMMEAIDNAGSFGPELVIATNTWWYSGFETGDVDGDEDVDLITGTTLINNQIEWYENSDGLGNFGPANQYVTDSQVIEGIEFIDIDSDNDGDIVLLTHNGPLVLLENTDGREPSVNSNQSSPAPNTQIPFVSLILMVIRI